MDICKLKLQNEGLILVAERPGMGKSYVMLEMANDLD